MLQRKPLHKRRVRQLVPKVFFLLFLFFLTIGGLFLWYFHRQSKEKLFVSPLVSASQKSNEIANPNPTALIEDELKKNGLSAVSIELASDSAILVTLDTNEQIIFSQKKDLNKQIASLQLIERELTIEGKRLRRVDFRFDNPVVSF